jgi:hypothetical protein
MVKMEGKGIVAIVGLVLLVVASVVECDADTVTKVKTVRGKKMCDKGWECKGWSIYCCNDTITDFFQTYQFENVFSKRNSPVAQAAGFWDYQSFITAAALYEPLGFGTTGGKHMQMMEIAAFLGHVGAKTSCTYFYYYSYCYCLFYWGFFEGICLPGCVIWLSVLVCDCVRVCFSYINGRKLDVQIQSVL